MSTRRKVHRILGSRGLWVGVVLTWWFFAAGQANAQQGYFGAGEAGVSYLTEWSSGRAAPGTAAAGVRAGHRWERWDLFAVANQEFWFDPQLGDGASPTLNLGVGVGLSLIDGHVRASLRAGTSTLLFDTRLSEAGQIGAFFELRPAGFRFPIADKWTVELHPLGFALTSPVLTQIPLFKASYRTNLAVEVTF